MLIPSSGSTTTFSASVTCSAVGAPPSLSWVVVSSLISAMLLLGRRTFGLDLDIERRVHLAARDVLHGDLPEPPRRVGVLDRLHPGLQLLQVLSLLVQDVDDVVRG